MEVVYFLRDYWQFISAGLLVVLLVISMIIKKKPQLNFKGLLMSIINWIIEAEHTYKNGTDKMNFVLSKVKAYLGESYDENAVRFIVEYVLSSPQKKESVNEKVK